MYTNRHYSDPHRYILGIDPGFANLGYALYDAWEDQFVTAGVLRTKKSRKREAKAREDNVVRFRLLWDGLDKVILERPACVCTEGMSQPRNSGAAWKLALGWGVVLAYATVHDIPVFQVPPMDLKFHLTRSRTADKDQVIRAVRKLRHDLQWPKTTGTHEHMADAVGALLTGLTNPDVRALIKRPDND